MENNFERNKIFANIKMATYKELYKTFKELGLTRTQKKKLGLKGRLNAEQLKTFLENYRPPREPDYIELQKRARELGYDFKSGRSKQVLIDWIKDREKKNRRNEKLKTNRKIQKIQREKKALKKVVQEGIETMLDQKIGVSIDADFKKIDGATYIVRDFKFNSTRRNLEKDLNYLVNRYIAELGGPDYWSGKIIDVRKIQLVPIYNIEDVPLKRSSAPHIEFFNREGKLIVDNKFFQNDNCVPEFLFDFIQSNNNKRGTKKLPKFSVSDIEDEIQRLWEEEESSVFSCNSIEQREARGSSLLFHQKLNEKYNPKKHGVALCQLENFCKEYNISLRCLDSSFRLFHTYTPDRDKRLDNTIMLIVEDGHIYPIIDKELRREIQGWNGKKSSDTIFLKESEKTITIQYEKIEYDKDFNIPELKENTTYITTDKTLLKNIFIKRWISENKRYKFKSRGQNIIELNLENNIKLLFNKDLELVDSICEDMKIPFMNQNLSTITKIIYPKYNTEPLTSYLNSRTKLFFEKYMSLSPWVKQYQNAKGDDIITYDKNKFYSSICRDRSKYIQFEIYDDITEFFEEEPIQDDTLYLVETRQNIMFQGTGIYIPEIVRIGLKDKLITTSDIKMKIKGSRTNETDELKNMVENFYKKLDPKLAKQLVNRNIGLLGSKFQEVGKIKFTNDLNVASTNFYNGVNNDFKIVDRICNEPELYQIDDTKNIYKMNSTFITNFQIIQEGIYKMYLLYKQIGGKLIKVSTDSITIQNPKNVIETSTEIGGVKIENKPLKIKTNIDAYYEYKKINYEILNIVNLRQIEIQDEWNIDLDVLIGKSFLLEARAGRGKTHLINRLVERYTQENKSIKKGAYTHCAKKLIQGETLHKIFGKNVNGETTLLKDFKKLDVMIIDEISMVPVEFYRELINLRQKNPNMVIILAGDFDQLKPVKQEHIEFRNSNMISDIVDFKVELKINKRCDNIELDDIVSDVIEKKCQGYTSTMKLRRYEGECLLNICRTNRLRKEINERYMNIKSKDVDSLNLVLEEEEHDKYSQNMIIYDGLKLRCRKNFMKEEIYNGEFFEVIEFNEKQIKISGEDHREHTFPANKQFIHNFNPNYCMTIHSTQGQTFNQRYIIHEKDMIDWRGMNVCLTRTTDIENIYFN